MFIHYGIYTLYERYAWVMAIENIPSAEYEARADECPDKIANRAVIELEFDGEIERCVFDNTPALHGGRE